MELKAGQIVTVDWRKEPDDPAQDPHPPEPNKLRPAVVVQETELFDPAYPTVLVVPMTGDPALAIPDLTVVLQPRPSNGCKKVSYLLPQNLTCVAKTRITAATKSQITPTELQPLRQPEAHLLWPQPMTVNRETLDKLGRFLLRGLRIGASTVSIVELLRNDWTGGISAGVAWLVFLQVERQLPPLSPDPDD